MCEALRKKTDAEENGAAYAAIFRPISRRAPHCHYPTGASKWNPIEHRVFSEITKRWAGQPLTDYPTIIRLIGETKTRTGLKVNCSLNCKYYPTKIKVPDAQMAQLDLLKHPTLPDWNHTLFPSLNRN